MRYTTKGKSIAYDLVGDGTGRKALDVGCRDGYWSERLKEKGYDVVACDLEPHYQGALQLDANSRLPLPDGEFDLVWCSEVIEHLLDPRFTVGEFLRVLKPGGVLVMTTPNQGFWLFRLIEALGVPMARLENEGHHFFFRYLDMREIVGNCEFYGYFPYVLLKFRISAGASLLSPTIVLRHTLSTSRYENSRPPASVPPPALRSELPDCKSTS
jgi:2-polyprenyl-3-methyl-5-hydroxy-6-metoxy-1,4-benzoquinol methylase